MNSFFKIKKYTFCYLIVYSFLNSNLQAFPKERTPEIYEIRIYSMKKNEQINVLDSYLKDALIPGLHRAGIRKTGVFKVIGIDTAKIKKMYVITPYSSISQWKMTKSTLNNDQAFLKASNTFTTSNFDDPPYDRMESILSEAFPMHLNFEIPSLKGPVPDRVYELRSYESPTEHLHERKVTMFNKGDEIGLFKRLNFNPVFYSSVISGSKMPNLIYMVSFENISERDQHWKQFGSDPQWKKISSTPEYENKVSVSHIDSILMHPAEYSEL